MKQTLTLVLALVVLVPISALFALQLIALTDERLDHTEQIARDYMEVLDVPHNR